VLHVVVDYTACVVLTSPYDHKSYPMQKYMEMPHRYVNMIGHGCSINTLTLGVLSTRTSVLKDKLMQKSHPLNSL